MSNDSSNQSLLNIEAIPDGRIGRFIVEREIGRGSVGTVYLFRDPLIGRKVAIKLLNPQLPADQRAIFEKHFIHEARAAGRLNHPNIVTVYDAAKSGDVLFIAMEYLEGKELRDLLSSGHQFNYIQIADIVARIANALDYAHQNGVVHRDIKPANIFIVGKATPKVLDFGIASATRQLNDPDASQSVAHFGDRVIMGTPNYMSPEQTRAELVDSRTDIFSLGVVLYQLLCGKMPFNGETIHELMESIQFDSPIPPHDIRLDVPSRLAYIAGKALAKKPADRYATAGEMAIDLNRFIARERTNQIIATLRDSNDAKDGADANGNENTESATARGNMFSTLPIVIGGISVLAVIVTIGFFAWPSHSVAPHVSIPVAIPAPSAQVATPKPAVAVATISPSATTAVIAAEQETKIVAVKEAETKPTTTAPLATKAPIKTKSKSAILQASATPAVGSVLIAVTPWGEVFVDGTSKGYAPPLSQLTLPTGEHTIEIRNGEDHHVVKIQVTTDKAVKIGHHF